MNVLRALETFNGLKGARLSLLCCLSQPKSVGAIKNGTDINNYTHIDICVVLSLW